MGQRNDMPAFDCCEGKLKIGHMVGASGRHDHPQQTPVLTCFYLCDASFFAKHQVAAGE